MYHCLAKSFLSPSRAENTQDAVESDTKNVVDQAQVKTEEKDGSNHDQRRADDFILPRPGDLFHFTSDVAVELRAALGQVLDFFDWVHALNLKPL